MENDLKSEKVQNVTAPVESMESIINSIKLDKEPKKRGRKAKEPQAEQEQAPDETAILIDSLLEVTDGQLVSAGLKPLNLLQKLMIKIGLEGTIKKYGLSISEYPEAVLICGIAWIGVDKYSEFQQIEKAKTEEKR